jgi:septum formation topological specificity factor MinE
MTKPTNPAEAKQAILEQFAEVQNEDITEEQAEEQELSEEEETKEEEIKTEPAKELKEAEAKPETEPEPEEEIAEPEEADDAGSGHLEKLQNKLVKLHKKYQEQSAELKALKEQNDESMQVLEFHVESRMKDLTADQRKLVKELAQSGTALDTYKSIRLLDKHGVLSQKTVEHKAPVTVDKTRVASESGQLTRPTNPAEARKNIVRQLRQMKG